ncbi:MAG: ATP-binding cassette domain-containing protein, partial [Candidatus Adiutrix sp.]
MSWEFRPTPPALSTQNPKVIKGALAKNDAPPVEVQGLTVAYGPNPPILENLSFTIKAGEIFGILGGSGSGKSSVLRNLIGLVKPRAGRVFIFGDDLWANSGREI